MCCSTSNIKKLVLEIQQIVINAKLAIKSSLNTRDLDRVKVEYLGSKGYIKDKILFLRHIPVDKRAEIGALVNKAKLMIRTLLNSHKKTLEFSGVIKDLDAIDVSLPGRHVEHGSLHPITNTINCIEDFFTFMGFSNISGYEIEDKYHNFDALNIPSDHPACTINDTFWLDKIRLLRTQTSSIQVHTIKNNVLPIRIITSGKVYRKDHDHTHTPMFHQVEGLVIDRNVSFANLKSTMFSFLDYFFKHKFKVRFRPSYFPFTEPSAEFDVMDIHGKWLEILGCGMVHPDILRNANIDQEIYSGFAFGIGVERLTMLRYNISDLRLFFENDIRFLKQFK